MRVQRTQATALRYLHADKSAAEIASRLVDEIRSLRYVKNKRALQDSRAEGDSDDDSVHGDEDLKTPTKGATVSQNSSLWARFLKMLDIVPSEALEGYEIHSEALFTGPLLRHVASAGLIIVKNSVCPLSCLRQARTLWQKCSSPVVVQSGLLVSKDCGTDCCSVHSNRARCHSYVRFVARVHELVVVITIACPSSAHLLLNCSPG